MNVSPSQIAAVDTRLHFQAESEPEGVSLMRQLGAALHLDNIAINVVRELLEEEPEAEPGFSLYDHLTPQETLHAEEFVGVQSRAELALQRERLEAQDEWQRALGEGPLHPLVASAIAVLGDPVTWIPFLGGASVVARGGTVAARAARVSAIAGAETAAGEVVLQAAQERRTAQESIAAIMLGGAFGLGLGAAGAKMADRQAATLRQGREDLVTVMQAAEPSTVGAMRKQELSPEDTKLAKAFGLEKLLPKLSKVGLATPGVELMASPFASARRAVSMLTDTGVITEGVLRGVGLPQSANVRIRRADADQAAVLKALNTGWAEHRQAGGKMRRDQFFEEVGRAMRLGDQSADEAATKVSKALRSKVYDPYTKAALDAKALLPEELNVKTALSYLPRVYRTDMLVTRAPEFDKRIAQWLMRTEQVDDINDGLEIGANVRRQILGTPNGRTPSIRLPEASKRGPLKQRTLLIPDNEIEDFLDSNALTVTARWLRTMAADIELHRTFQAPPDQALEDLFHKIDDEADAAIEAATSEKARVGIRNRAERDKELVGTVFRRVRGTDLPPTGEFVGLNNLGVVARNVNIATKLGSVLLANIADAGKISFAEGMGRTLGFAMRDMANGFQAMRLGKRQAQQFGTALEVSLGQRAAALMNFGEREIAIGSFERAAKASAKGANFMMRAFMLAPGLEIMKGATSALATSRILATAEKVAAGKALTKHETIKMAQAGLDEAMMKRIATQAEFWEDAGSGVRLANVQAWQDAAAADALTNAVVRDVDDTVITPFEGDFPIWAGKSWGKVVGQFRRFMFAASGRNMLAGAQRLRAGDMVALSGLTAMAGVGAAVAAMRDIVNHGEVRDRTGVQWASDAIDRSGALALFYEMDNLIEPAFAQAGLPSPIGMATGAPVSRFAGREPFERIAGPSAGLIDDILAAIPPLDEGSEFSKPDLRDTMRLIPGRNAFYASWLFNMIEEEIGRGLPEKRR